MRPVRPAVAATIALGLAVVGACDEGSKKVPPSPSQAICEPMPEQCPTPLACAVTTADDGIRTCSGEACCRAFCEANGCARCCR